MKDNESGSQSTAKNNVDYLEPIRGDSASRMSSPVAKRFSLRSINASIPRSLEDILDQKEEWLRGQIEHFQHSTQVEEWKVGWSIARALKTVFRDLDSALFWLDETPAANWAHEVEAHWEKICVSAVDHPFARAIASCRDDFEHPMLVLFQSRGLTRKLAHLGFILQREIWPGQSFAISQEKLAHELGHSSNGLVSNTLRHLVKCGWLTVEKKPDRWRRKLYRCPHAADK